MSVVVLQAVLEVAEQWKDPSHVRREEATRRTLGEGNRFTAEAIIFAINQQVASLQESSLREWTGEERVDAARAVGVFNPGNIPFAGFQDLLAVLLTGHRYVGKLSSKSPHLLPAFVADLRLLVPDLPARFADTDSTLAESDAVIITGSDEAVADLLREALDAGIPPANMLLRGHRYSAAVIGANENESTLEMLAEDLLLHEGLGCRSPAVVWAPNGESPDPLLDSMAAFRGVFPAHDSTIAALKIQIAYQSALGTPMGHAHDGSFLLTKGHPVPQQPAHIRWTEYDDLEDVCGWIRSHADELQLISTTREVAGALKETPVPLVAVGNAQRPEIGWRQDGKDVVAFLRSLA